MATFFILWTTKPPKLHFSPLHGIVHILVQGNFGEVHLHFGCKVYCLTFFFFLHKTHKEGCIMLGIHVRFDDISEWVSWVISLVVKGRETERERSFEGAQDIGCLLWPEKNLIERWIKLPRDWGHLGGQNVCAQELSGEMRFGEEALCLWPAHCEMRGISSRSLLFRG